MHAVQTTLCNCSFTGQQLTARAPWSGERAFTRSRGSSARCAGGAQALASARSRATGARRTAQAAIGLGLELGDGEAARVELSIGYPVDIRCLPPLHLDVRCLPPLRLDVAGAVLRHVGHAERSSRRHSSQRSHAGRPVSSSAPEGGSSTIAWRAVLRWAVFGGRLARSSKSRQLRHEADHLDALIGLH